MDKIYLRPVELADAVDVLAWENDVENWSSSNNDSPFMLWDIVRLIEELMDVDKAKQARWIISRVGNEERLGAVDLCDINFEKSEAVVGILVANKTDRNKGIATESLKLLDLEAERLGIQRLLCSIHPENKSSVRLFERCGFQKIGLTKEKYMHDGVYIEALILEKWLKN